ncbi:MAG: hypothetical protein EHM42_14305, partial [Planctomycetaceae bacterium]
MSAPGLDATSPGPPRSFSAIPAAEYPQDWAWIAGVERSTAVTVIDADVSTVSAAADKVLRIGESDPWILIEWEGIDMAFAAI